MKKVRFLLLVLIMILMTLSPVTFASSFDSNERIDLEEARFENIITLGVGYGDQEVGYTYDIEGNSQDGPLSFTVVNKNCIYILDTVNQRILEYQNNKYNNIIDISFIGFAEDIVYNDSMLYILDEQKNIYELSLDGEIIRIIDIPDDLKPERTSKLGVNNHKNVVVISDDTEYDIEQESIYNISDRISSSKGYKTNISDTKYANITDDSGNILFNVDFIENTGGVEFISSDSSGNIYLFVQDDVPDTSLVLVENTIRKYDKKGNLQGVARIPMEDYCNFPNRFVNVAEDGKVYIMELKEKSVEIDEIKLGKTYKSQMNKLKTKARTIDVKNTEENQLLSASASISLDRGEVESRADDMISITWQYRRENSINMPSNVKKPDYLAALTSLPTWEVGPPYCWGGFDGVDRHSYNAPWTNFLDAMNKNAFAGNVNTAAPGYIAGTAGLDCSGFVGSAYGLTTKMKGSTIHSTYCTDITYTELLPMDILVKDGSHILLFDGWNSAKTSAYTKEATTTGQDCTKNYSRTKSWLMTNGYVASTPW